ncbi:MAG: hypothetical protein ABIP03_14245 [Aquihabitans sp.]
MDETATTNPLIDETVLDELVPPLGPRWRRVLGWVSFLGISGAFIWAATTGTVIPRVSTGVQSWGGDGPVMISGYVVNDSRVDIELAGGPRPVPGLALLGYTTGAFTPGPGTPVDTTIDPFPIRLHPGERIDLTAWYRVTDCAAVRDIDFSNHDIDLQVRIADGPASWLTVERPIDATGLMLTGNAPTSWPAAIAEHVCRS